jgi:hypothetical protein
MEVKELVSPWECFCDPAYYDKWAVRNKIERSFYQAIHVNTKEEAEFLVTRLNQLELYGGLLEWIHEEADSDNPAFKLPEDALEKLDMALYGP